VSPQKILTSVIVMTRIVDDKSTDSAKPHSTCFSTTISTYKENVFSRARAEKGIA